MVVTEAPKLAMPSSFCFFSSLAKRLSNLKKKRDQADKLLLSDFLDDLFLNNHLCAVGGGAKEGELLEMVSQ